MLLGNVSHSYLRSKLYTKELALHREATTHTRRATNAFDVSRCTARLVESSSWLAA